MDLQPHQQLAVDKMHNGCILNGDTGVGKGFTALAYYYTKVCGGVIDDYFSMRTPTDVYVITTAKKRDAMDWQTDAAKLGISRVPEASVAGVTITVDSFNNLEKYTEVENAFFIFDEQRLVGSGAWSKAFIKIAKRNKWIMLTATPGDTWIDYIPVFVANGFYKNRTDFKRQHVVYKPYNKHPVIERYNDVGRLVRHRNKVMVEMPYVRHTVREAQDVEVTYDEELMNKAIRDRWHVYEQRPLRNVAELFLVMRKIANSDPSRLDAVKRLMIDHPKLIVFYNFDYELEILRTLNNDFVFAICDGVKVAEWNGHKHEPVPDSDKWVYLVQYQAGAESWNCIETNVMCFYSLTYSYKIWHQAHGRIDRLNTPFTLLKYYVLISNSAIDKGIRRALRAKKSFNEADFAVAA